MDSQTLINTAIALVGALGGMVVKALWDGLCELRNSDRELAEKVHAIETLVAGKYQLRDESATAISAIFAKLDAMNVNINNRFDTLVTKMEAKVDKLDCQESCGVVIERRRAQ